MLNTLRIYKKLSLSFFSEHHIDLFQCKVVNCCWVDKRLISKNRTYKSNRSFAKQPHLTRLLINNNHQVKGSQSEAIVSDSFSAYKSTGLFKFRRLQQRPGPEVGCGSPLVGRWSWRPSEWVLCHHHLRGPSSLYHHQLLFGHPPVPPGAESYEELQLQARSEKKNMFIKNTRGSKLIVLQLTWIIRTDNRTPATWQLQTPK